MKKDILDCIMEDANNVGWDSGDSEDGLSDEVQKQNGMLQTWQTLQTDELLEMWAQLDTIKDEIGNLLMMFEKSTFVSIEHDSFFTNFRENHETASNEKIKLNMDFISDDGNYVFGGVIIHFLGLRLGVPDEVRRTDQPRLRK